MPSIKYIALMTIGALAAAAADSIVMLVCATALVLILMMGDKDVK